MVVLSLVGGPVIIVVLIAIAGEIGKGASAMATTRTGDE